MEGYFVHFFAPENLKPLRKHVVFILDISGSMWGRKMEQLKEAQKKILDDLNADDFFNIITFSGDVFVRTSLQFCLTLATTGYYYMQKLCHITKFFRSCGHPRILQARSILDGTLPPFCQALQKSKAQKSNNLIPQLPKTL